MSAALRFAERSGSQIAHEINRDIQDSEDFMEAINLVCIELTAAFDGTHGKVTRAVASGMATELALDIACGLGSVKGHKKPAWLSQKATKTPLPSYAVDLLIAAKFVLSSSPEMSPECRDRLGDAVQGFEENMPIKNGTVREIPHDRP